MMGNEILILFVGSLIIMGLCDLALVLVEHLGDLEESKHDRKIQK